MSAGLSCTRWHRSRWQRIRDAFPPPEQIPAFIAALALLAILAVEVLRPDLVWRALL